MEEAITAIVTTLIQFGFTEKEAAYAAAGVYKSGRTVDSCVNDAANVIIGLSDEDRAALEAGRALAPPMEASPYSEVAAEDEECKMMLCVRSDLGMSTGKMCAQCGHAAVGAIRDMERALSGVHASKYTMWLSRWEQESGSAKIAVKIDSEAQMEAIVRQCRESTRGGAPVPVHIVRDAGRTEIAAGSKTVVAVGPAPKSLINDITGKLELL
jgi:PTH2 family peptidyl-tRNA hydrolase